MNWFILLWQMGQVAKARKTYDVHYPTLYETKQDSKFNLVQRAHQSTLEWNGSFLPFLLLSGISSPIMSSAAGVIYNLGRVKHAQGYYAGSAHKGLWSLYALLYLAFGTVYTAFKLLLQ